MAFTLNGSPVQFDLAEFESLVKNAGGFTFRWATSSMGPLRELAQQKVGGHQMRMAVERIGAAKTAKYDKAVRYLIFHYEGLIPDSEIVRVLDPRKGIQDTFDNWVTKQNFARERRAEATGRPKPPENVGDLIYGLEPGRKLSVYKTPTKLTCDDFNNSAAIGTGRAFEREWAGSGTLDATPTTVLQAVRQAVHRAVEMDRPDKEDVAAGLVEKPPVGPEAVKAYEDTIIGSRYSPETVFDVPKDKLKKDTHQNLARMHEHAAAGVNKGKAHDHVWMHARFVKSVRRACKGGIAMAATHPLFKEHKSKVFFILDLLGDLGNVAFKKAHSGDYVPITTSELSFVFRYWNHGEVPLSGMLKFFVNGREVLPPWDGDWTLKDAKGNAVYSNQEAWKRYSLYRSIAKPGGKPFPVSGTDEESAES